VSEGSEPNLLWDLTEITRIDDNESTVTVTDVKNSLRCRGWTDGEVPRCTV